jgi:hypothetical protein
MIITHSKPPRPANCIMRFDIPSVKIIIYIV